VFCGTREVDHEEVVGVVFVFKMKPDDPDSSEKKEKGHDVVRLVKLSMISCSLDFHD
jgi:hypothetical protein